MKAADPKILDRIAIYKRAGVNARKAALTQGELEALAAARERPRGFRNALVRGFARTSALIAEIKRASRPKG